MKECWALIRNILMLLYISNCVCILVSDDVLKFLQDGLSVRPLASISAVGIQNLCRYCKGQMANLFDSLLEVVRLADTLGISNNSVIGLMTGECRPRPFKPLWYMIVSFHLLSRQCQYITGSTQ